MDQNKKLLIISVSNGAGHVRAGQAVEAWTKKLRPDVMVTHIDMMDYAGAAMSRVVHSYDLIMRQAPWLWGYLYDKMDNMERAKRIGKMTKTLHRLNAAKFYEYVRQAAPDVILSTHFLPAYTLVSALEEKKPVAPVSVLVTDYSKHALWLVPGLAQYFVAHEKIKWEMALHEIAPERVVVSGIPAHPVFYGQPPVGTLRKKHGLPMDQKVILLLSGGHGLSNIAAIVGVLAKNREPAAIIAVAGKNKALEKKLRGLAVSAPLTLRVFGWTNEAHELMALADAIITKPGGLTTSECMALQKPIIVVNPIPGQEEQNTNFILEHGYGVSAATGDDLLYYLSRPPSELAPAYARAGVVPSIAGEVIVNTLFAEERLNQKS